MKNNMFRRKDKKTTRILKEINYLNQYYYGSEMVLKKWIRQ